MLWFKDKKRHPVGPAETLVVYTAIFGSIPDRLRPPARFRTDPRVRFVCFTDRGEAVGSSHPWEIRPAQWVHADPRRTARYHKILSHVVFPEADYTLWLDGNVRLIGDPWRPIRRHLEDGIEIATFKHPHRNSVYEELDACVRLDKDDVDLMRAQVGRYRALGYPSGSGLAETRVVARRHSEPVRAFNQAWWSEIENGSLRDQLSFNFVLWRLGQRYAALEGRSERSPYVRYFRHR